MGSGSTSACSGSRSIGANGGSSAHGGGAAADPFGATCLGACLTPCPRAAPFGACFGSCLGAAPLATHTLGAACVHPATCSRGRPLHAAPAHTRRDGRGSGRASVAGWRTAAVGGGLGRGPAWDRPRCGGDAAAGRPDAAGSAPTAATRTCDATTIFAVVVRGAPTVHASASACRWLRRLPCASARCRTARCRLAHRRALRAHGLGAPRLDSHAAAQRRWWRSRRRRRWSAGHVCLRGIMGRPRTAVLSAGGARRLALLCAGHQRRGGRLLGLGTCLAPGGEPARRVGPSSARRDYDGSTRAQAWPAS